MLVLDPHVLTVRVLAVREHVTAPSAQDPRNPDPHLKRVTHQPAWRIRSFH
jgi:hypothetical protein